MHKISDRLQALSDIYCAKRARDNMVWGKVHFDTDFPHVHLMISANAAQSAKRTRLSRAEFAQIQQAVEQEAIRHFPDLQMSSVYGREAPTERVKTTRAEGERKGRTSQLSQKERAVQVFRNCLKQAKSEEQLQSLLKQRGYQLYHRGQIWGVEHQEDGKRYRLPSS